MNLSKEDALDRIPLPYVGYREFSLNLLMRKIIHPIRTDSGNSDPVLILREILCTGISKFISIKEGLTFEVTHKDLMEIIPDGDILFTMVFASGKIFIDRDKSGFFLDFNLVWGNLAPKIKECFEILTTMLSKEGGLLEVEFFGRTGLKRTSDSLKPINIKHLYLYTTFSQSGFNIDSDNQEDIEIKVLSMLFWMMMEPNIVAKIKLPTGDMTVDIYDYLDPSDTMSFTDFHNHELSNKHGDIISYIMEKFIDFYANFLGGDQKAKIFDLRK